MVQVRMTKLTMAWMYTTPSACHGLYVHMRIIVYVYHTRTLACTQVWVHVAGGKYLYATNASHWLECSIY